MGRPSADALLEQRLRADAAIELFGQSEVVDLLVDAVDDVTRFSS
jgi:hypothetical protein